MKIKLKKFDTVIYTEEHIQEVRYVYSIDDSVGLLEINLTIPEEADPVESFVWDMKDLYRGLTEYIVYHTKYRYTLNCDKYEHGAEYYLSKYKMY